jgi:hypothetical protein
VTDEPSGGMFGGGLGDELRQLLAEFRALASGHLPAVQDLHTGPECGWCPVCQFVAVLQNDHPEAGERVKQAGAAIVVAARAVMKAAAQTPAATADPPGPSAAAPDGAEPGSAPPDDPSTDPEP